MAKEKNKKEFLEQSKNHVKWPERISYASSDFALCICFGLITNFLMYFYTDIFGISAAAVGILYLVARIVDIFDGPFWGLLIDHTNTRWGKSRPYWLWFAVPYGLLCVLVFYAPDLSMQGKIIYVYITYIAVNILYSSISIPITSILANLTPNPKERITLSTIRQFFGTLGSALIAICAFPMVSAFGQGDQETGFFITAIIMSIISVLMLLNTFAKTRERVQTKSSKQTLSIKESFKALKGNWPWFIVIFVNFNYKLCIQTRNQVTVYFCKYNMNAEWLTSIMLGLILLSLISCAITPMFSKKFGKRNTTVFGMLIAIAGQLIMFVGSQSLSMEILIIGNALVNFGTGFVSGLIAAMFADAVDYGEWKNGVRAEGFVTSFFSFSLKFGMGIGSVITGMILYIGGYIANEVQSAVTLQAFTVNYVWIPIIGFALCVIALSFYKVDKFENKMHSDLIKRRKQQ